MNYLKARKRLSEILSTIIHERKEKKSLEKDLIGCLLNTKDDKGEILTEDQISDNIIGVLFAAQDTTASVMTWILKYLHDDPKLLEAVKVGSGRSHIILSVWKVGSRRGLSCPTSCLDFKFNIIDVLL